MKETESQLFQKIKAGDFNAIEKVYILFRADFFRWAKLQFGSEHHDLEDVWQDTIIAFFENVKNGKLLILNSSLKTYFFSIGKNIILNKLRKENRIVLPGSLPEYNDPISDNLIESFENDNQEASLLLIFESLGSKCKELLISRYYLNKPVDMIRLETGLDNNNVVSASLSRCLKHLKELVKSKIKTDGK